MQHAIRAEGLVKRYGETRALDGVDLVVPQGRLLGVLGPNGAGKTTAVRILATLLRPDEGRATVGGFDVVRQAHQVRSLIGLTGQYAAVDEMLTGVENLVMIGRLLGMSRSDSRRRAAELLERFALSDAGGRATKTYSGGMRRRLDLAASLVGRPQVLFLDEPTTGLDPRSRTELWSVVRGLMADGVSVLLTTQYLEEADQLADDIVVFDHGRVIASGTSDELKATTGAQVLEVRPLKPADLDLVSQVVADVIGEAPDLTGGRATASVHDPAVVPAIVRRLDDLGVVATELALRKSSLDEVFLALTGHRAEEEPVTEKAATAKEEVPA
ncbi:daunorubicin resistance protein DrrA family ABC transporter ATP-binding protein [Planomonospora parontospora subsp. parontospora]|uniref:Daunorubicin resistance protein DrrA family ABC transporter ATP-binding protein n=2 Tax=Planomonospora parontospora TaxID=58119 RepID=A0AA37BKQ5_9ACTN|nr:ATP-binding cassette domain-containing protein [Planomonospora parontospora]GGK85890.1 daunorubicin resistance protein DrrA family ABC transporter ATP-binding protein [Planomonospora parontospora]GII10755.1 daunorubicin resistance protein DrrA family ABC transporter ATP-binding protein [Planomonospora parontospora subsp. parontospora]